MLCVVCFTVIWLRLLQNIMLRMKFILWPELIWRIWWNWSGGCYSLTTVVFCTVRTQYLLLQQQTDIFLHDQYQVFSVDSVWFVECHICEVYRKCNQYNHFQTKDIHQLNNQKKFSVIHTATLHVPGYYKYAKNLRFLTKEQLLSVSVSSSFSVETPAQSQF